MTCPFCNPETQSNEVILESSHWRLIYNLKPFMTGHCLIIPIRHAENYEQLNEKETADFDNVMRRTWKVLKEAYQSMGFNLILQDGKSAGQTVPHLHYHIIPRRLGDVENAKLYQDVVLESKERKALSRQEMSEVVRKLRKYAQ